MSDWDDGKTERVLRAESTGQYDASEDAFSIGNLARNASDKVGAQQIQEAVEFQKANPGVKMGEAMVRLGYLTDEDVVRICHEQRILRTQEPSRERSELVLRTAEKAKSEVSKLDGAIDRFNDLIQTIASKLSK